MRYPVLFFLLSVLTGFVQLQAQPDLGKGLMAYYPFNGNAYDESPNKNDPSIERVTYVPDRTGKPASACAFNGKSNYIRIPDHPTLNFKKELSLSAWVKIKGFYDGKCHGNRIIMKGYADRDNGNYLLTFDDNHFTKGRNCNGGKPDKDHQQFYGSHANPVTEEFIETDRWYHLVYTYDGQTASLYVNGKLTAKGEVSGYIFSNDEDLFFGKLDNPGYPYWYHGLLDEVRLYNRVITQEEIAILGATAGQ